MLKIEKKTKQKLLSKAEPETYPQDGCVVEKSAEPSPEKRVKSAK